jgi:hypothetical protein
MADAPRVMPEHLRAALERARANPMPPGAERNRLVALANEVTSDPSTDIPHAEMGARIEARRPQTAAE